MKNFMAWIKDHWMNALITFVVGFTIGAALL